MMHVNQCKVKVKQAPQDPMVLPHGTTLSANAATDTHCGPLHGN